MTERDVEPAAGMSQPDVLHLVAGGTKRDEAAQGLNGRSVVIDPFLMAFDGPLVSTPSTALASAAGSGEHLPLYGLPFPAGDGGPDIVIPVRWRDRRSNVGIQRESDECPARPMT